MLNKNIRRCAHIKTNGTQCGSPAARGHELCHFHWRAAKDFPHRRSTQPIPEPVIDLALIDSPDAIHYALMQIVQGINNDTLSEKKSGRILWALQVMSSNFKQTSFHRQLEDEYSSSNLNCYQIWDKIKQETEDQQRAELHEKRIEEIKRLQKTCCKCHQLVEGESQLTTTAQPATTPAPSTTSSATPNFAIITVQPNSTAATESQPSSTTQDQLLPTIKASADTQPSVLPITKSSSHQVNKSSATSVPFAFFASFALKSVFQFNRSSDLLQWPDGPITQWSDSSVTHRT